MKFLILAILFSSLQSTRAEDQYYPTTNSIIGIESEEQFDIEELKKARRDANQVKKQESPSNEKSNGQQKEKNTRRR